MAQDPLADDMKDPFFSATGSTFFGHGPFDSRNALHGFGNMGGLGVPPQGAPGFPQGGSAAFPHGGPGFPQGFDDDFLGPMGVFGALFTMMNEAHNMAHMSPGRLCIRRRRIVLTR